MNGDAYATDPGASRPLPPAFTRQPLRFPPAAADETLAAPFFPALAVETAQVGSDALAAPPPAEEWSPDSFAYEEAAGADAGAPVAFEPPPGLEAMEFEPAELYPEAPAGFEPVDLEAPPAFVPPQVDRYVPEPAPATSGEPLAPPEPGFEVAEARLEAPLDFGPSASDSEAPAAGFEAPPAGFEAPAADFEEPAAGFEAPAAGFEAPAAGFEAPLAPEPPEALPEAPVAFTPPEAVPLEPLAFAPSEAVPVEPLTFAPPEAVPLEPLAFAPPEAVPVEPLTFAPPEAVPIEPLAFGPPEAVPVEPLAFAPPEAVPVEPLAFAPPEAVPVEPLAFAPSEAVPAEPLAFAPPAFASPQAEKPTPEPPPTAEVAPEPEYAPRGEFAGPEPSDAVGQAPRPEYQQYEPAAAVAAEAPVEPAAAVPPGAPVEPGYETGGALTRARELHPAPVIEMADRLEILAHELRERGIAGMSSAFRGDALDAALAGLISGYLAGRGR